MNFKEFLVKEVFYEPSKIHVKLPLKVKVSKEISDHVIPGNWHSHAYENFHAVKLNDIITIKQIVKIDPSASYNFRKNLLKDDSVWVWIKYKFDHVNAPVEHGEESARKLMLSREYEGYIPSAILNSLK